MQQQRGSYGNTVQQKPSSITAENGMLAVRTPYNYRLVDAIKGLPYADRRWDPARKVWLVSPDHGFLLVDLIETYTEEMVSLPIIKISSGPEIRLLEVHYIGRCKDRNGEKAAFGMLSNNTWGITFPEKTLRDWFDAGDVRPGEMSTLYAVLGINKKAGPEDIKTGYRRMAKAWHPDLNKNDPDAADQFRRIQQAWEILSIPKMRARYDAGLELEASMGHQADALPQPEGYRSPLRNGWIMAEGVEKLGRFVISKILEWQDIYNGAGQVLVTSWSYGAKEPTRSWA